MSLQLAQPHNSSPASSPPTNSSAGRVVATQIIAVSELDQQLYDKWLSFCHANPVLDSPYFHPEFTKCVAKVRNDVEIAILKNKEYTIIGFLPFQRVSESVGNVVGGRMSDFNGIISTSPVTVKHDWLMNELRLKRFDFHALITDDRSMAPFVYETMPSYFVDLSGDLDVYLESVRQNSSTIRRLPQKIRALQRDVGEITYEFRCNDQEMLENLIQLKREKFQRTNTFDILSVDWAANLLRAVNRSNQSGFSGFLCSLTAGEHVVASQFGMITGNVLHYWFPVFDPKFAKYSPGLQLMLQTCQWAHAQGITRIDMSYGESAFKHKFCTGTSTVNYGSLNFNPIARMFGRRRYQLRKKLKQIPMKSAAKAVLRKVFPGYGKWHFK